MRHLRAGLLSLVSLLAACGSFRDVFTSHAETAARVGSHQLKSAYVADIINRVGGANANPQAAELVTNIWVDFALFGHRVATKTLKPDSTFLERLLWPQLAQSKSAAWHDTVLAHRPAASPGAGDSVYNKGDVRLFQHLLIRPKGNKPADSAAAKAQAEGIVAQANRDFGKTAAQYSADESNKNDKGLLPPGPKGMFDPAFEAAAWTLEPGQTSGVVKSSFGFHIIRRPRLEEVRDRFATYYTEAHKTTADSVYFMELQDASDIKVRSGAPAAVRSAVSDLSAARKSHKELVSYKNGSFTVADFARWMGAMQGAQVAQIRQANDSLITQFLRNLTVNTVLLRQADSAKVGVPVTVYQGLVAQYTGFINDFSAAMGLNGPEFSDSSKTSEAERLKLAEQKVDEYFAKVTKGETQYRQMPPTLSAELRSEGDYKVYQAGIARAVELILAKRRADSAAGPATPPPAVPGTLQPAPGGPPQPGKTP